jgi:hypothetical protein
MEGSWQIKKVKKIKVVTNKGCSNRRHWQRDNKWNQIKYVQIQASGQTKDVQ